MFFRYPGAQLLVIYSHGNACDMGEMYRDMSDYSKHFKAHVLGYEYPSYGCYQGYAPNESSINETIEDVTTFARTHLDWPTDQIIFFGRSLGSGPTIKVVSDLEESKSVVGGMILQSAYTSIKDVANNVTGAAKVLQVNRWESLKRIAKIKCPVLFIHGKQDKLIPYQHSQKLFDVCQSQSKVLHLVEHADHNTWADETDIIKPGKAFIDKYIHVTGKKKGDDPEIDQSFYAVPDKQKITEEMKNKVIQTDGRERDWSLVGFGGYHKSNTEPPASGSSSSSSSVTTGSSSKSDAKHSKQPSEAPSDAKHLKQPSEAPSPTAK